MSRLAVVTGGARGIGLAIVRALEAGVADEVVVWDRETSDIPGVRVMAVDVTDAVAVRSAYADLGGVPKILVNNAGGGPGGENLGEGADPFGDVDLFRRTVDLNLTSAHVVTSVVGPDLQGGAAICNTASIAGLMPNFLFAYAAAKTGLIGWTRSMALALAPRDIRVNAVAPGIIHTDIWEKMTPERARYDELVASAIPMGRHQSAEEIAAAVAFLCSDAAASITGQVLAIDGGMTLGRPL